MADDAPVLTLARRLGLAAIATESDGEKAMPDAKLHGQCACIHRHMRALSFLQIAHQKKSTLCFNTFDFLSSTSNSLLFIKGCFVK